MYKIEIRFHLFLLNNKRHVRKYLYFAPLCAGYDHRNAPNLDNPRTHSAVVAISTCLQGGRHVCDSVPSIDARISIIIEHKCENLLNIQTKWKIYKYL